MADETKTILIDIEVENKDFDQEIGKVNKAIKTNREEIKELSKDYDNNATAIAKLDAENRDLAKSKQKLIKESKTESNSLDALRLKVANLTKERNGLDTSTKEGAKRFAELNKQILENTIQIKEAEEAGGDFRRNVGNYTDKLRDAATQTSIFGVSLGGITEGISSFLNPLTATVGLIGALGAAYLKTGRGSKDLARASDRLEQALSDVGNSVADVVGSDGKGAGLLDNFLRVVQFSLFGLASTIRSEIIVSVKESIREFQLAVLESDRLAKSFLDQAEKLRQVRDEERNTLEERLAANEELGRVINEREAEQIKTQETQINNLKFLLNLDKENLELQISLKEAEFALADIREEASGFRSEQLINDLGLARESAELQLALRASEIENEIILAEDGSFKELELKKKLIEETAILEIEAVGKNEIAKQTIRQNSINAILLLEQDFIEKGKALLESTSQANKKAVEDELKDIKKVVEAKALADKKEANDVKTLAALKLTLTQGILNQTLGLLFKGEKANRAATLSQVGFDTGKAISGLMAASEGNPLNLLSFGGAGILQFISGMVRIAGNVALAKKAISSKGSGSAGFSSGSSSGGFGSTAFLGSSPNQSLLSGLSTPAQGQANQNDSIVSAISNLSPGFVSVVDINEGITNRQVKVSDASLIASGE